jgi:hypothetical protein
MSHPLPSDTARDGCVESLAHPEEANDVTDAPTIEERKARLVRNLLALRTVLSLDQMQTGRWSDRIEEIDEELASLGHDMKSTAACAMDGLRRSYLLPRLVNRRLRSVHRPARPKLPRD